MLNTTQSANDDTDCPELSDIDVSSGHFFTETSRRPKMPVVEAMIGKKFGEWKPLEILPVRRGNNVIMVRCECSCGAVHDKSARYLRVGKQLRCDDCQADYVKLYGARGRLIGESAIAAEMVGKRFGDWEILSVVATAPRESPAVMARCSCGVVKPVNAYSLRYGKSSRCGSCASVSHSRARRVSQRRRPQPVSEGAQACL